MNGNSLDSNLGVETLADILDQPESVLKLKQESDDKISEFTKHIQSKSNNLYVTGCGSSYFVSTLAKYLFPTYINKNIDAVRSSQLKVLPGYIFPNSTLIAISQSGRSKDVVKAVQKAPDDCTVISIVNDENQLLESSDATLLKRSDLVISLHCGEEKAKVATKTFTSQIIMLYRLLAELSDDLVLPSLETISDAIKEILENKKNINYIASQLRKSSNIFVVGNGIHFPIAQEAARKLEELAHIHTNCDVVNELEHGPMESLSQSSFVIIINPKGSTYEENLEIIKKVKQRNAKIIGISNEPDFSYDYWIPLPKNIPEEFLPMIEIVPLQLLACYTAIKQGIDPDDLQTIQKVLPMADTEKNIQ